LLAWIAILKPMTASPIHGQYTTHGRDRRTGWIGAEQTASFGQLAIQMRQDHARLESRFIIFDSQNSPHRMRKIENQAAT
jgi:hypothetical protein